MAEQAFQQEARGNSMDTALGSGAPTTADNAPQSSGGLLGFETALNRRIFGESPREAMERMLGNEFRGVGALDQFAAPGFEGRAQGFNNLSKQLFGLDPNSMSQYSGTLAQLAQGLQATAAGQGSGQSLADRAAAQQQSGLLAQQAGARGPQAAAAARQFGANQGNIAQTAVQGRMQAQQQAAQQLQQLAGQQRAADIQAGLQARGLGLEAQKLGLSNAEMLQQAMLARQQARTDRFGSLAEAAGGVAGAAPIETAGVGALGGVFGAIF